MPAAWSKKAMLLLNIKNDLVFIAIYQTKASICCDALPYANLAKFCMHSECSSPLVYDKLISSRAHWESNVITR